MKINCCLGDKNEKCLKLTAQIVEMIDRDLLSSIPSEIFLAADTDQCHMYSHGCVVNWPQSRMSPISYVIALLTYSLLEENTNIPHCTVHAVDLP